MSRPDPTVLPQATASPFEPECWTGPLYPGWEVGDRWGPGPLDVVGPPCPTSSPAVIVPPPDTSTDVATWGPELGPAALVLTLAVATITLLLWLDARTAGRERREARRRTRPGTRRRPPWLP